MGWQQHPCGTTRSPASASRLVCLIGVAIDGMAAMNVVGLTTSQAMSAWLRDFVPSSWSWFSASPPISPQIGTVSIEPRTTVSLVEASVTTVGLQALAGSETFRWTLRAAFLLQPRSCLRVRVRLVPDLPSLPRLHPLQVSKNHRLRVPAHRRRPPGSSSGCRQHALSRPSPAVAIDCSAQTWTRPRRCLAVGDTLTESR